jgi:hypothetical protein
MPSSNVLYVVSKEEMEHPSGPLAFPTKFAQVMGEINERSRAAEERESLTRDQVTASLANESREQALRLMNAN